MTSSQSNIPIPIEDEVKRLSIDQAEFTKNELLESIDKLHGRSTAEEVVEMSNSTSKQQSEVIDGKNINNNQTHDSNEDSKNEDSEKSVYSVYDVEEIYDKNEADNISNTGNLGDIEKIVEHSLDKDDIQAPLEEDDVKVSSEEEGSDFDDFDDFEKAESFAKETDNLTESEDVDDFGDFDDFTQASHQTVQPNFVDNDLKFEEYVFADNELLQKYLWNTMDQVFPQTNSQPSFTSTELLNERSSQIYTEISRIPRLKPPNWIKLKIRHNLLIKLGIPINLDDLNDGVIEIENSNNITIKRARRKSNLQPEDIKWDDFEIPEFKSLNIDQEQKQRMITQTNDRLSKIETDILNNTSKKFLEDSHSDDVVNDKLLQLKNDYKELIQLSSVWNNNLQELQKNFEIYESVVQSTIGYSQKLRRDEILDDLKKLSKSKQKKKLRM